MECLILNGNPQASGFDGWLKDFATGLAEAGHQADLKTLRDLKLRLCSGCWSCWWRTPGLCTIQDDMEQILPAVAKADLVVWASPLILGAPSALLKSVQDRFIPMIHPYIVIHQGEFHHRHRYAHNADVGLIIGPGDEDGPEDEEICKEFFRRFALNTKTRFKVFATTRTPLKEALNAAIAD